MLALHDHARYAAKQLITHPTISFIRTVDDPDKMDCGADCVLIVVPDCISFPRRERK